MEKKQSSVDFLIEQIEIILKLNNVELSAGYTIHTILPIIEKLKAMHKEEICKAFDRGRTWNMSYKGHDYYDEIIVKGNEE